VCELIFLWYFDTCSILIHAINSAKLSALPLAMCLKQSQHVTLTLQCFQPVSLQVFKVHKIHFQLCCMNTSTTNNERSAQLPFKFKLHVVSTLWVFPAAKKHKETQNVAAYVVLGCHVAYMTYFFCHHT